MFYKHAFLVYIVKLGFTGVYLFFSFLIQNTECGYWYSLESPRQATIYVLSNNIKKKYIYKGFKQKVYVLLLKKFSVYCMGKFL